MTLVQCLVIALALTGCGDDIQPPRTEALEPRSSGLVVVDVHTGKVLHSLVGSFVSVAWSPRHLGRIAATRCSDNRGALIVFELGTEAMRQFKSAAGCLGSIPSWSPDGKKLALYETTQINRGNLVIRDVSTGKGRILASDVDRRVAWAPNGTALLSFRDEEDTEEPASSALLAISYPRGHVTRLVARASANTPATWLPDSVRILAFQPSRRGDLALVVGTSGARRIGVFDDGLGAVSANGTLAISGVRDGEPGVYVGAPGRMRRRSSLPAFELAWSPDGRRLALVDERGTVRILVPSTGSVKTVLKAGPVRYSSISWGPDSRRLVAVASRPPED
jgi:Tol biopolymer transport system component